ncbi:hypothetical protein [Amycolatopsis sp. EV170708-02-1]|uniref:hypothetical protein n=1 Tax=Amycolatopsis sp. EV170708-02-1 TaxID=2919322 RepID=UPI0037C038FA
MFDSAEDPWGPGSGQLRWDFYETANDSAQKVLLFLGLGEGEAPALRLTATDLAVLDEASHEGVAGLGLADSGRPSEDGLEPVAESHPDVVSGGPDALPAEQLSVYPTLGSVEVAGTTWNLDSKGWYVAQGAGSLTVPATGVRKVVRALVGRSKEVQVELPAGSKAVIDGARELQHVVLPGKVSRAGSRAGRPPQPAPPPQPPLPRPTTDYQAYLQGYGQGRDNGPPPLTSADWDLLESFGYSRGGDTDSPPILTDGDYAKWRSMSGEPVRADESPPAGSGTRQDESEQDSPADTPDGGGLESDTPYGVSYERGLDGVWSPARKKSGELIVDKIDKLDKSVSLPMEGGGASAPPRTFERVTDKGTGQVVAFRQMLDAETGKRLANPVTFVRAPEGGWTTTAEPVSPASFEGWLASANKAHDAARMLYNVADRSASWVPENLRLNKISDEALQNLMHNGSPDDALAALYEAVYRKENVSLRWTQLSASNAFSDGHVVNMMAGEGKSWLFLFSAARAALRDGVDAVHYITTRTNLADPEFMHYRDMLGDLGFVIHRMNSNDLPPKRYPASPPSISAAARTWGSPS